MVTTQEEFGRKLLTTIFTVNWARLVCWYREGFGVDGLLGPNLQLLEHKLW